MHEYFPCESVIHFTGDYYDEAAFDRVAAGWSAALIKRPGNDVLAVGPQSDLVGADLDEAANQLIRRFAPQ